MPDARSGVRGRTALGSGEADRAVACGDESARDGADPTATGGRRASAATCAPLPGLKHGGPLHRPVSGAPTGRWLSGAAMQWLCSPEPCRKEGPKRAGRLPSFPERDGRPTGSTTSVTPMNELPSTPAPISHPIGPVRNAFRERGTAGGHCRRDRSSHAEIQPLLDNYQVRAISFRPRHPDGESPRIRLHGPVGPDSWSSPRRRRSPFSKLRQTGELLAVSLRDYSAPWDNRFESNRWAALLSGERGNRRSAAELASQL